MCVCVVCVCVFCVCVFFGGGVVCVCVLGCLGGVFVCVCVCVLGGGVGLGCLGGFWFWLFWGGFCLGVFVVGGGVTHICKDTCPRVLRYFTNRRTRA